MSFKRNPAIVFAIMCVTCILVAACTAPGNTDGRAAEHVDTTSEHERIARLMSVIKTNGVSVWVEYHATCFSDVSEHIPLGLTIHSDKRNGKSDALSAVQDSFRDNKSVSVGERRTGVIVVKSDDVWAPVLQAKVVELNLTEQDRYNPVDAIYAGIMAGKGSLQALRARPAIAFGGLREIPSPQRPHLNASARYETLEDLLDDVTRTFGGILIYRECVRSDGSHIFDIDFYRKDEFAPT